MDAADHIRRVFDFHAAAWLLVVQNMNDTLTLTLALEKARANKHKASVDLDKAEADGYKVDEALIKAGADWHNANAEIARLQGLLEKHLKLYGDMNYDLALSTFPHTDTRADRTGEVQPR